MSMEAHQSSGDALGADLEPPLHVGSYELYRILGQGGVATTYLGRDLARGGRVAVKAIHLLKTGHRHHIELFEREADALKGLSHPQIPSFYETLVTEQAETITLYLAQQFVEGRSLEQRLREGQTFSPGEVVLVLLSCLEPLEYLHTHDPPLYHRDIKPSNIILREDGTCVLVDFGAVREALADPKQGGSSVVGTFGYMAPEQFQARVGPTTDLYALGASALHLLTGRHPKDFEVRRLKPAFHDVLKADSHLAAIVDLLLEPVDEDRYQSAESLRRALRRWSDDHPNEHRRALITLGAAPEHAAPEHAAPEHAAPEHAAGTPTDGTQDAAGPPRPSPIIMVPEAARSGRAPAVGDERPALVSGPSTAVSPSATPISETSAVRATQVPLSRTVDPWYRLFDPRAAGYAEFGAVFLALALLGLAAARVRSGVGGGLIAIVAGLAMYGLAYFVAAWHRRRSRHPHRLPHRPIDTTDGELTGVELRTTLLGTRHTIVSYRFTVDGRTYEGMRLCTSRRDAAPFLRRKLPNMVWYDEADPTRSTLEPG